MGESLFLAGFEPPAGGFPQNPKKSRTRVKGPSSLGVLTLEPHVCRHCFGRLASEALAGTRRRFECTNCGASATGSKSDVLCACGLQLRHHGPNRGTVDAGIRCRANPSPTPEFPSLFVAGQIEN